MNVDRLLRLATIVRDELNSSGLASELSQLSTYIESAVNSPGEQSQRNVENQLTRLAQTLGTAKTNDLSPGLRGDLHELRARGTPVDTLLGVGLHEQLTNAVSGGYTSVQTLDKVRKLYESLAALKTALDQLLNGATELGQEAEDLAPGTSIVGMTIPRPAVAEGIRELQKEIAYFAQFLSELTECTEGHVERLPVEALRSSAYGIDVNTTLKVASAFATIITGIKGAFDILKKYRELKKHAEEVGVEDTMADQLADAGRQAMENKIDEVHAEIMQSCKIDDKGRVEEIRNAIKLRINGVANRMDRGFTFEVRTALPPQADEDQKQLQSRVAALSTIRFEPISGPRLLALPEDTEAGHHDDGAERKPKRGARRKAEE